MQKDQESTLRKLKIEHATQVETLKANWDAEKHYNTVSCLVNFSDTIS
jgi:hypothetical protein